MVWWLWSLVSGLSPGALAAWAVAGPGRPAALGLGALAGGVLLATAVWLLSRRLGGGRTREARLAAASGVGWVAAPALVATALGLRPGAAWLLAGVLAVLVLSLARGARSRSPVRLTTLPATGLVAVVAGAAATLLLSAVLAAAGPDDPGFDEGRARAIYDLDARVPTRPLRGCSPTPSHVAVIHDAGAHPRLGPEGRMLWFDAPGPEGRRQVQRLERASGEVRCWTCGEPGHNVRPAPGNRASGVVFDTDRHVTLWDPTNTELHLAPAKGDRPSTPSRRLTYAPGPDDHAILARATGLVIWSRFRDGGYRVVSAPIRSAHGGLRLGGETLLAAGGTQWVAPAAWSPDARSLVVARGNPYRPLVAVAIDFAADRRARLAADVASGGSVSFSADGGRVALARARRGRVAGLLPASFGFALGPLASRADATEARLRGTALDFGEAWGELRELEIGDVTDWGEPTGVTLAPDGESLVLAQRRRNGDGLEERLLEIRLACDAGSDSGH